MDVGETVADKIQDDANVEETDVNMQEIDDEKDKTDEILAEDDKEVDDTNNNDEGEESKSKEGSADTESRWKFSHKITPFIEIMFKYLLFLLFRYIILILPLQFCINRLTLMIGLFRWAIRRREVRM